MTTTLASSIDFTAARRAMIDSQLRTSGVNEPFVLERMNTVPREDFVPESMRATAYADRAIRLGEGKMLPAPIFHGAMLAEAQPRLTDSVLVVDGGSGYLSALVEPLVERVRTMSPEEAIGTKTRDSYSLVLIDGAVEHLPKSIAKLLDDDGRIVTGLSERGVTRLAAGRKSGKALALVPLAEVGAPRLTAFDRPSSWSF